MSADNRGLDDHGLSGREAAETVDSTTALVTNTPLLDACSCLDMDASYAAYDTEPVAQIVLSAGVLGIDNNPALRRRLQGDPWLLGQLGFDAIPSATTLWRIRTKRFEDVFYSELRAAARTVARRCREHGLEADGPPEQSRPDAGDGRLDTASQTVAQADRLTDAASQEVYPELSLERDDNTAIPDTGFWGLASFLSTQADSHANAGAQRYLTESRQTTPLGDNFRAQLSALSLGEQRAHLQSAAANLVREACAEGHLDREVPVAVDTTTGPRFWGDRSDHEDTILGTKAADGEYAYHYATLQIVDEDAPIILDARPVERGEARDEIVADLLDGVLGTVTPSVVLMDREFDTEGHRGVCERRDVAYLTPGRRTGEQGRLERLAAGGVDVFREPHGSFADRTREVLYERADTGDVETTVSAGESEQTM
jgi:hypothetical protein